MRAFNIPLHLQLANSIYTQTALSGGVSINADFEQPKTGYLVSIKDGLVFDSISLVNVHELSAWIKENTINNENYYFGGWIDQQTKKVYFDLSANYKYLNEAIDLAKQKNQLAIWDLNENKEIRVN